MSKLNLGRDLYLKGRIGWQGLSKDEYLKISDYKIINATSLKDGFVDWSNCGYITKERYDEAKEIQLQENDILISKDGTLGKIGYVKNINTACSVASGIFVLRNTKPDIIDFDFLYHVLKGPIFKDFIGRNKSLGSTISHLYQRDLETFELDIPDIAEQKKIAKVLNSIDSKIFINNSICSDLEAMSKTMYDYWFVQFDFPDKNGKPYKSSGGKMVWNGELKREIPEEWSASKIKSFCTVTSGYPFESESYLTSGHYKLITIKNIQDDGINLVVNNFIETLPSNLPEYCKLKDGDILMSLTGNVGRVGLMYDNSCLLNQRVAIINPSKEAIRSYVYFLFKSDSLRMTMERIATGSAQKNLSPVSTELLNIPYDNVVAEKYSMIIDSAMKEMVLRLKENYELIRLRDFLLPLLMNGQVVINE